MKELTREKLNKILEEHKHWADADCKNWEEMRADLRGTDLRNAGLSRADLRGACLREACLNDAYLSRADLSRADLHSTDLRRADLRGACLSRADLFGANLSNADLSNAALRSTDLHSADLINADLINADLSGADFRNAYLYDADLRGAKNVPYIPMVCPEEGDFIGWKKAGGHKDKVIVKLRIPSDAKRSSATTRKCRCSKAEVIAIYNLDGTEAEETTCHSDYDNSFIYEVGKTVEVTDFDEDRWNECAKGIHFFISRQEAIDY